MPSWSAFPALSQEQEKQTRRAFSRIRAVRPRQTRERSGLEDHATGPSPIITHLAGQQLAGIERLTDTLDTWTNWNTGQPTTTRQLIHTLDTLTIQARHAPLFALHDDEITSTQLHQLTEPLAQWLTDRGIRRPHRSLEHDLDRSGDFGIGL